MPDLRSSRFPEFTLVLHLRTPTYLTKVSSLTPAAVFSRLVLVLRISAPASNPAFPNYTWYSHKQLFSRITPGTHVNGNFPELLLVLVLILVLPFTIKTHTTMVKQTYFQILLKTCLHLRNFNSFTFVRSCHASLLLEFVSLSIITELTLILTNLPFLKKKNQ